MRAMRQRSILMLTLATAMLVISVPALAAPNTMQLSSWTPEVSNGTITGGTRTVTVANVTDTPVAVSSISIDPAPCDCAIKSYVASQGTLAGFIWTIDRLEPGATAELTIRYKDAVSVVAGTSGAEPTVDGRIIAAVSVVLLLAGMFLARPDRFGITSS